MKKSWSFLWLLAAVPLALGLTRLQLDVEMLDLLPGNVPAVEGLSIYQHAFASAGELVITVRAPSREASEGAARAVGVRLRERKDLIGQVFWEAPWLEHPTQVAEFIAYLWFNQPPEVFGQLTNRLASTNLPSLLSAAREQLATSMSPADIAQLSYDPFGLTRLPESVGPDAPGLAQGQAMFASPEGTFRVIFAEASVPLHSYRDCRRWLQAVKEVVQTAVPSAERASAHVVFGYTGRPAFVSEIASGMERDITGSVIGTALVIALLFWLAHRRWRPMLWLLTLLGLILLSTLALGGLFLGTINVLSMGFAAILLGLAVDYAVVHYQEALAHPELSIPQVRHAIAPSIFWAATTTLTAFLILNFGGLPGLGQLGSLVALGVGLSALVMIFAYLPPLFPDRRKHTPPSPQHPHPGTATPPNPPRVRRVYLATLVLVVIELVILASGSPQMDTTANALRPRDSAAYSTLENLKLELGQKQEPLWLIVSGQDASEVTRRLDALDPVLSRATLHHIVNGTTLPTLLLPRPERQRANRVTAWALAERRESFHQAAKAADFTEQATALSDAVLDTWRKAAGTRDVFWPTNDLSRWILGKQVAQTPTNLFALGLIYPAATATGNTASLSILSSEINRPGVWLTGWSLLGPAILKIVRANLWNLLTPMVVLVLASLCLAFRRLREVGLSVAVLVLSALGLLSVMRLAGWSWNLLNLMALPLILGTGVDYSIFMQLALRRHQGDLAVAHRSVGRALLLCGGTAVAGFGSLAFSSNVGMASLGQICAVGIGFNVLISVFLLPIWWKGLIVSGTPSATEPCSGLHPSRLHPKVLC